MPFFQIDNTKAVSYLQVGGTHCRELNSCLPVQKIENFSIGLVCEQEEIQGPLLFQHRPLRPKWGTNYDLARVGSQR